MQATLPAIPTEAVTVAVTAFLAGSLCPSYYAQERLRGFGRAMVDQLPYRPPPGMSAEDALSTAVESAAEADADDQEDDVEDGDTTDTNGGN